MIISVNSEANFNQFNNVLTDTLDLLNVKAKDDNNKIETLLGRNLEPYIRDVMSDIAKGTPLEGSIELIGGQKFPDIVANKFYGIEVKTTTQNHWKTTGNSVMETTRVADVERIFMLFAKLAKPIEFKCRPYQDVLSEVVVTHSPRYLIDMNLSEGETIFDKIDIPYDTLRKRTNPIKPIIEHYKKKLKPGEELWWMENSNDIGGKKLRFFSNLDISVKEELITKSFAYFPEMLSKSQKKYSKIAFWLVTKENIICPNVRDSFSAGGQDSFYFNGVSYNNTPKIIHNLFNKIPKIVQVLKQTDASILSDFWEVPTTNKTKIMDWINLVQMNSQQILIHNGFPIKQAIFHAIDKFPK